MFYVSLVHGLAFLLLGVVAALQAGASVGFLPKRATYLLSAFAIGRGIAKWAELSEEVGAPGAQIIALLGQLSLIPIFLVLAFFGTELLVHFGNIRPRAKRRIRLVPAALLALWIFVFRVGFAGHENIVAIADALFRYLVALPAALLTACGFLQAARIRSPARPYPLRIHYLTAAGAFALYGLLAGLFVPKAPFSLISAGCAAVIAIVLSHAFTIQVVGIQKSALAAREDFLSMMVHDLRAPLTNIQMNTQLLERFLSKSAGDRERGALHHLLSSVKHLDRMLSDLFDASLIEINHLPLSRSRVEMTLFLEETVERSAQGRRVLLDLPRLPVFAQIDADRVEQVLSNLLSNARKYSPPDSVIRVHARTQGPQMEIAITNDGPGIRPEDHELIFTRFYRTKSAAKGRTKGTGLGLFITRALVEAHGGTIGVQSEPGQRTTFRLSLPLVK